MLIPSMREKISEFYHANEAYCIELLLAQIKFTPKQQTTIQQQAQQWIICIREQAEHSHQLNTFLAEYNLSTAEGMALMALAESLLRVPDNANRDRLIEEHLSAGNWEKHIRHSSASWVNAATWGLLLTGKIVSPTQLSHGWAHHGYSWLKKISQPMVRQAMMSALHVLGHQFVLGKTLTAALMKIKNSPELYSFDMLGEAACTAADAQMYFESYCQAIQTLTDKNITAFEFHRPSISVKLSALHPRFEFTQQERLHKELYPHILHLAQAAKDAHIGLTIDAEEAVRLDITLDLFATLRNDPSLQGWNGLGLAVQAYQKRAPKVIDWLIALAQNSGYRIPVRLVKGAYWDTEIKLAQEHGYDDYPVYTHKQSTDVSYLVCAKKLLAAAQVIYPQFGTHNAYTVAAILSLAGEYKDFEWQRLQGMGQALYAEVVKATGIPCRVYAPVGKYEVLLPYLARRLLENGANSSFVHQIADSTITVEKLTADPCAELITLKNEVHTAIPLPRNIFPDRVAAKAFDLSDHNVWKNLQELMANVDKNNLPDNADKEKITHAISRAKTAGPSWNAIPVAKRAEYLLRAADLLEDHMPHLMALVMDEGKKTISNAQAEIREAIDYCRYYANQALSLFSLPQNLPGPTGESNRLTYAGRGAIVCISPWNFPLAIFLGQITAALVAGNTVLAKPAEQTPRIAQAGINILHAAGIPQDVLQILCGEGSTVGNQLVNDPRIDGVIFTGSTETAQIINLALAQRKGAIIPLIAETGGVNAMVVDSTALLEQAVHDIVLSAFDSAGQRCSACRVLLVQEEIADRLLTLLAGNMAQLQIGDPHLLSTDIGPVIDTDALSMLQQHQTWLNKNAQLIYQVPIDAQLIQQDTYFAPCVYELNSLDDINAEIFGPILHVVRYRLEDLPVQLAKLQAKGFGLTLGIHTRLFNQAQSIAQHMDVGNIYINRSQIGAVVGCQPFGGQGLSGTGPKAGGPNYLLRLVTEKVVTINTTAAGGNAHLMA